MSKKIVLAYSGGLDTSVLLSWIKETYNAEVIAFCANVGQDDELKGLNAKAKKDWRLENLHRRPPGGIRHRFHLPDDPGRSHL
jgi:tRNA(Ile)-lysidine synthase TilS/MesJ